MKKLYIFTITFFMGLFSHAQSSFYNVDDDGYGVLGYDLVSYFSGSPEKGMEKYSTDYKGVKYKFYKEDNLKTFREYPEKYLPQYGGWCSYAMAKQGKRIQVNPKTFEIRDDKLYLFYNRFFTNTFEDWKEDNPDDLVKIANAHWQDLISKNKTD